MNKPRDASFLAWIGVLLAPVVAIAAADAPAGSPVAANGELRTRDNRIVNAEGKPVQLRGVCTHGLQWHGEFYASGKAIDAAAKQWGADVIRLSVYVYERGYLDHPKLKPEDFDAMIDNIVQACVRNGVYCILDWHIHHPGDPAFYLKDARAFFEKMSKKYAHLPNVIYEIANEPNRTMRKGEPNGREILWKDIVAYADDIIPIIRKNAPKAMVLVGTPAWSSLGHSAGLPLDNIINHPLDHDNVAYVLHVYAANHTSPERLDRADRAARALPLFVTEWAAAGFRTDSTNDPTKAKAWLDLFARHQISWTYWNFAAGKSVFNVLDKTTTPNGPFAPTGDNVTETGKLVYEYLSTPADAWRD